MKKLLSSLLVTGLVLSVGIVSFADSFQTPAEIYANLTGKTVEEAYKLRGSDKTFGQLAENAGVYEKFKTSFLESKKQIIADKVANKQLTQEKADEILGQFDNENRFDQLKRKCINISKRKKFNRMFMGGYKDNPNPSAGN